MSVKWLFVVWQLMEIVISAQETQTEEPLTTGNGLLFLLSCAVALIGGCSASLAFTFYLDWSRAALDEQLEQRTGYLNKTRTKLSEQRVKLVQLIREEAELFEMEHQAETRIQNDRKLHEREFGRKAKEAEKAKRVVGYAAARNHIHQIDDAETLALRGRLQQERNAMAESIRKKLNRATHAREQVTQRAREEAQKRFCGHSKTNCRIDFDVPSSSSCTTQSCGHRSVSNGAKTS
ncbi:hypothetical protein M3Y94_00899500 [Aphelenchoides besseyi]|nr:hypothetical protein M3Y94_00899500 [Aphelenchoides besseyi]